MASPSSPLGTGSAVTATEPPSERAPRRYAVEPVAMSVWSHKKEEVGMSDNQSNTGKLRTPPKRRFVPEPLETTFKSSRKEENQYAPLTPPLTSPEPVSSGQATPSTETPRASRKFKPQLIESSRRSKKADVDGPAMRPVDKTDITPGTNHIYLERKPHRVSHNPGTPGSAPADSSTELGPFAIRGQGSTKPHLRTCYNTRPDAYHPALEPIMSESTTDNEDSMDSMPSLSGSLGSSADSTHKTHLHRSRSSCDERFSGYLLALAAETAEKQLKDQALAAFPNEYTHETVEHFYTYEDNSTAASPNGRHLRRGSTGGGWAAREMQVHQEKLERLRGEAQRKEDEANKKQAEDDNISLRDPFWTNGLTDRMATMARGCEAEYIDLAREEELEKMRKAASPPMLGGDLIFRTCPSPKRTKFESDQKFDATLHQSEIGGGLWGGYCVAEQPGEYLSPGLKGRQGLIHTPLYDSTPLPSGQTSPALSRTPKKQRSGVQMLAGLDERLQVEAKKKRDEERMHEEFDNAFVTQVYNYLSLGYPSMARPYDDELARISKVKVKELRGDDDETRGRGHLGLVAVDGLENGESGGDKNMGEDEKGARWKALRLYIHEWARQNPGGLGEDDVGGWGVRERRGSWAI